MRTNHHAMPNDQLAAGASPQLRNMATVGGNLLQRTRCLYFRDGTSPCNKRNPGSGCTALESENRGHAVLGGSDQCVALAALDAVIQIKGRDGECAVPLVDFHLLPGEHPERETVSVAAALDREDGIIKAARLALGSVGTKPWRAWEAEAALAGQPANAASYRAAAEVALRDARPLQHNGFKIEMAKRAITRALETLGALP
jgi:xanthine dehydrogenase YagS FAD-binding subunit